MLKKGIGIIRRPLGILRRKIRRTIQQRLYPRRQAQAMANLRDWPLPGRVTILCLGNVCRSPYAEAYLSKHSPRADMEFESAGFIGPGRPPPEEALQAALRRDVDTSGHISQLITREMVSASELMILVDPKHLWMLNRKTGRQGTPYLILGDLDPTPTDSRKIVDPWGEDTAVFDAVFERIDRCLDVILDEWRRRGS